MTKDTNEPLHDAFAAAMPSEITPPAAEPTPAPKITPPAAEPTPAAEPPPPPPPAAEPKTDNSEQELAPNDTEIRNPRAKLDAERKKFERLTQKMTTEMESLTAQVTALTQRAQESDATATVERVKRLRTEAALTHGLSDGAAEFITAETPEEIAAQAKKLSALSPTRTARTKLGNSGGVDEGNPIVERMKIRTQSNDPNVWSAFTTPK